MPIQVEQCHITSDRAAHGWRNLPIFATMVPELAAGTQSVQATGMGKRIMPLRVRLIVLIGLVLLISLACGSALVGWRAANSVRTELRAALDVGMKTIRNGIDGLVGVDDRVGELRHLVATFNGNRHVRATLLDGQDQPVTASHCLFRRSRFLTGSTA